ncbi:hypothetical protein T229_00650 [Tannerella sp. oral taxon BU063 isolate Cell 5]|uniref:Uncharacterized protein n=1 Tax=Tannerella sp. oral taxon BU063 isolate Cell 5 TaxID=1410950 RepID=W2CI94_9BACT|nr:hypothetical protein T229_00650 [Tannerella sp. oral taxon BU063 isolate Cell 5]
MPQEPSLVDAELDWQENSGQLIVLALKFNFFALITQLLDI